MPGKKPKAKPAKLAGKPPKAGPVQPLEPERLAALAGDGEIAEEGEPLAEEFERFFLCPLCGARVSVLLDPSVEKQTLIEDCEVCCQPLEIRYTIEEGKVAEFDVQAA
jgi:hypothetical protein